MSGAAGASLPRPANDAPQWAIRVVQDIVDWVENKLRGPFTLTSFVSARLPSAAAARGALIYDATNALPAFSNGTSWTGLQASGGPLDGSLGATTPAPAAVTTLAITQGAVISGVYTPTLTNSANISSSTPLQCQYMRVGNVVTVSGGVTLTPTLIATLTTLGISLPVASAFSAAQNLGGAAASAAVASASAAVSADTANARATFQMISVGNAAETFYLSFTYLII